MKSGYLYLTVFLCLAFLSACSSKSSQISDLTDSLTFHASFDHGPDADFFNGDGTLYTAIQIRPELVTTKGLPEEASLVDDGRFGKAISFKTPEAIKGTRAFYKLPRNFPYESSNWEGTVSFWLKLTPNEDLRPGFTDPIQLTSKSALDAGIWVDFTDKNPRRFRMGVFPDKIVWNPKNQKMNEIPEEDKPWIPFENPPFSREHWTHVVMTIEGFNNPGTDAVARLYIDGKLHGDLKGHEQTYSWDLEAAQIRLGVNFVGSFDELSCFDRALTVEEVETLYHLEEGVTGLLR
jgi:hypothetical protein